MNQISKHFSRYEFLCNGVGKGICECNFSTVDIELITVLEDVRERFQKPVSIMSGCRCDKYNTHVGGAKRSKHKLGIAADIQIHGVSPKDVYNYLINKYSSKYGIGYYPTFVHIDVRQNKARW